MLSIIEKSVLDLDLEEDKWKFVYFESLQTRF